jgi:uncharacterized protein (TIGR03790 family)
LKTLILISLAAATCGAVTPGELLVVGNSRSAVSKSVAEYYARARQIPARQVLLLPMREEEEISREEYSREIERPVGEFLKRRGWVERILGIVTTAGVPLKIRGGGGMGSEGAAVDSELAALYGVLKGQKRALSGAMKNPYFGESGAFRHPEHAMYLVARLGGYTFADIRAMIDRSKGARNRGVVVLDLKSYELDDGNAWLKDAARRVPRGRALVDESTAVVRGVKDVIGYASWGSNDPSRKERDMGFGYLPGAVVTEYVSTDGRTLKEPPAGWRLGSWKDRATHWAGSPQSLAADFIRQGATAATGHVYEPYLAFTPRPQILFENYLKGRSLGESYYASIPALSWMNVLLGDPLCRLGE